jgi:hypothetical protein
MASYQYSRELVNGRYNINNINHTEGGADNVHLFTEIINDATLPNEFNITCVNSSCVITFANELSGAQQTALDNVVAYHKTDT